MKTYLSLTAASLLCVLFLLAGCGGNGDEEAPLEPHMGTQPVDCAARPEACK